jgi:hypothetical protein
MRGQHLIQAKIELRPHDRERLPYAMLSIHQRRESQCPPFSESGIEKQNIDRSQPHSEVDTILGGVRLVHSRHVPRALRHRVLPCPNLPSYKRHEVDAADQAEPRSFFGVKMPSSLVFLIVLYLQRMSLSLIESYESEASEDDCPINKVYDSSHQDDCQLQNFESSHDSDLLHGINYSVSVTNVDSAGRKRPKLSEDDSRIQYKETKVASKSTIESLKEALIQIVPSDTLSQQRSDAWQQFLNLILKTFPELSDSSSVEIFGSWAYHMWIECSDIDCNVRTPSCISNFFLRLKSAVCSSYARATVRIIAKAKVPVAKIVLADGLKIDVTHDHGTEKENERHNFLVREWASRWQTNEVVCSSIRIIKQWATTNKIHDPCSGTLNSMGYLVMLVALLSPDEFHDRKSTKNQQQVLESVLELLLRFFSSYQTLGRKREVICAPFGTVESEGLELDILRLSSAVEDRDHRGTGSTVFIQDPFLPSTNLGRFVDKYSGKVLRDCFVKAHNTLVAGGGAAFQILLGPNRNKNK